MINPEMQRQTEGRKMTIDLENLGVASAAFPARVVTAMKRAQITSLGQIDRISDDDLASLHRIGGATVRFMRKTIDELCDRLHYPTASSPFIPLHELSA